MSPPPVEEVENVEALHEKQHDDIDENKPMDLLEQSDVFKMYSPATLEIISIAREEGDVLSEQSLNFLNEELRNAVVPQGYSPQGNDALDTVKKVATVTKDFLDAGKILIDKFPKYLQVFGPLGSLIKNIIDIAGPKKKDPVLEELGNLKNQLEALSQKMTVQFDALKGFMVEKDFYNNYAHKASLLYDYMVDCATVDKKAKERFEECYKEIKPERYVRDMLIKLKSDVTNPLKVSMAGDELTSKATFEKWKVVLASTLAQFLILECFATGLLHPEDDSDSKKIMEKMTYYDTLFTQWEKYYLNDRPYWPKLKKYVEKIQGENSFGTDEDMSTELLKGIETIFTNDNFYICVFNRNVYSDYYIAKPEMVFVSKNIGKFNVIISRAFEHSKDKCDEYWKMTNNNIDLQIKVYDLYDVPLDEFPPTAMGEYAFIVFRECSYFLAFTPRHVAVRWTRKHGAEEGPGIMNWNGRMLVSTYPLAIHQGYKSWDTFFLTGE